MKWFVAKLIFEIKTDGRYPQFDEQLRIIEAINEELALEMAYQIGIMQKEAIVDIKDNLVTWKFIAVTEIQGIDDVKHGTEIHYKIAEPEQADQYLALVAEKAAQLKKRQTNLPLSFDILSTI